jgi:hydrogenase maturation factor
VSPSTQPPRGHADEPHCDPDEGCVTCGDVAEPMRVLGIDRARELALCSAPGGERRTVEIALVQPVEVGDELLVHAGTGISNLRHPTSTPTALGGVAEEAVVR